jgi:hypothetical protein
VEVTVLGEMLATTDSEVGDSKHTGEVTANDVIAVSAGRGVT